MDNFGWIKIRESLKNNMYEIWDSKKGVLYGCGKEFKDLLLKNINNIHNSDALKIFVDVLNNQQNFAFNKHFEMFMAENVIIINSETQEEFLANEIVYDVCKFLDEPKMMKDVLDFIGERYETTQDNMMEIYNLIFELIKSNIIIIP